MELRQLRTFATVAELLSFNRAAKALGYAQSTVSAQVQGLEESLNAPLFARLGRRVELTPVGERLLEYAHRMIDLEEEARGAAGGEVRGRLCVAVAGSVALAQGPALVRGFGERFPGADLEVRVCPARGLAEELSSGGADVALTLGAEGPGADLVEEELARWRVCLAVGRGHALAGRLGVPTSELVGETLFLPGSEPGVARPVLAALAEAGVEPARTVEMGALGALAACVAAGEGVGVMPEPLLGSGGAGCAVGMERLVAVQWAERAPEVPVRLVRHAQAHASSLAEGFMEAARRVLGGA
jgi:DNA-binding transcriptional LysR family regulator